MTRPGHESKVFLSLAEFFATTESTFPVVLHALIHRVVLPLLGSTESKFTGPDVDHTTGSFSGVYMYIEVTDPRVSESTSLNNQV